MSRMDPAHDNAARRREAISSVPLERETVICNKEGLHFRPIMRLVDTASSYLARITIQYENRQADGRSPMELFMLAAPLGARLRLTADGDDAETALDALVALIESGFDET